VRRKRNRAGAGVRPTTPPGRRADFVGQDRDSAFSTEQVSASAQQSSASTQQIAAATSELAGLANELDRLVGNFTR